MHWRDQQINAFDQEVSFKQDHDLINYIQSQHYTSALARGDADYFRHYINFVNQGPTDFCIYILNEKFKWDELIIDINNILEKEINVDGIVYLSINKFLAEPVDIPYDLNDDYDLAIKEYIEKNVNAEIEDYFYKTDDCGQYFNFAHPITRFYLRKTYDNH